MDNETKPKLHWALPEIEELETLAEYISLLFARDHAMHGKRLDRNVFVLAHLISVLITVKQMGEADDGYAFINITKEYMKEFNKGTKENWGISIRPKEFMKIVDNLVGLGVMFRIETFNSVMYGINVPVSINLLRDFSSWLDSKEGREDNGESEQPDVELVGEN